MKGNFIDRDTKQNGCGWRDGEMYTLDATDRHGVAYGIDCRNATLDEEKTHTVQAKANGGISLNCTPSVCYRKSTKPRNTLDVEIWRADDTTNTLNTFEYSDVRTAEIVVERYE
jgi:hypothetical protein